MTELDDLRQRFGDTREYIAKVQRQLDWHDLSLNALARVMAKQQDRKYNVVRVDVWRWFSGAVTPSLASLIKISDAFDQLIYGRD